MIQPVFSRRAVAALFLERQHLDRPRARRLTAASLARFAEDTGGIQLDSINVVDRAHHLTLWSRFGPYERAALDRLIYRRRVLFEYWAHVACLVSAAHFPAWRRAMLDYRHRHKGWTGFLKKHPTLLRAVETAIRERGPLGNADFQRARRGGASGWWSWKPATHALDFLWMSGHTAVDSRLHFQKRFDLLERVLPVALVDEPFATAAFRRWHLERSLHAMGAATETDLRMYLTFPRAAAAERRAVLREMLLRGDVVEIAVAGDRGRWYALARDLEALSAAGRRRAASRGATLLSPFDSFLWHRERVVRLFGYDYRIEVYVPAGKRTFGYYTLPLFVDGQLVGRADTKLHRAERRLELRHVHLEPWFAVGGAPRAASWGAVTLEHGLAGLAEAAWSLATFTGAERMDVGRVTPGSARAAVRKAIGAVAGAAPAPERLAAEPGYATRPTPPG
jgi:uncharacterized protein YcaQ